MNFFANDNKNDAYLRHSYPFAICIVLFLCFLEHDVLTKFGAVLLILYLTFNKLLIFTSPVGLAC